MSKTLVAYFSASGETARLAKTLAQAAGGDLYAIVPEQAYTSADLNWNDKHSRSSLEMNDPASRPAIAGKVPDMGGYDTVFVGYPIWWYVAPTIVKTFLESYDFSGKTMIDFCTSGGSGISTSEGNLKELCSSDVNWLAANRFSSDTDVDTVRDWVQSLGIETKITNGGKDDGVF